MRADAASFDLTRAIVSAFCSRGEPELVPTSTLAVQHELRRRNRLLSASDILNELSDLRDIQRVERGYWLPSPTHLAAWSDFALVVSGLPNQELKRESGLTPAYAGVGRVIRDAGMTEARLPIIPLSDWIGAPPSTRVWANELLNSARYTPPFAIENAEVFRHWKMPSQTRWIRLSDPRMPHECTVLARHRSADHRSNYYLLRVRAQRVHAMHEFPPMSDELIRLMCGLRCIGEDPVVCHVTHKSKALVAKMEVGIMPRAERRLLRALGSVLEKDCNLGVEAVIPHYAIACVVDVFESLGCKVEMEMR